MDGAATEQKREGFLVDSILKRRICVVQISAMGKKRHDCQFQSKLWRACGDFGQAKKTPKKS